MDVVDRIKKLCREYNITPAYIERELGFSNGYISKLRGREVPYTKLAKIADLLRVSPDYLATGTENAMQSLSTDELELLTAFKMLNVDGKTEALKRIHEMTELTRFTKDTGRSRSLHGTDA